jgi:hypothetical protein
VPTLKLEDDEFDIDALEAAEYDPDAEVQFEKYSGEQPEADTILRAYLKSMWLTYTAEKPDGSGGDPMLKLLVVAAENTGTEAEFDGLPIWENLALTPASKFKWKPFIDHFGLTLKQIKTKMVVADDDDNVGAPITKIDKFVPGSDESWCRIVTSREKYQGNWQTHVGRWLEYTVPEEDEADADTDDADADAEVEVEMVEEEAAPPARGRRAAVKPAAAKTEAKAAPARGARTAAKPATAKASAAPARGRGRRGTTTEAPF